MLSVDEITLSFFPVPSIYSIGPPNGDSALMHGHHMYPSGVAALTLFRRGSYAQV